MRRQPPSDPGCHPRESGDPPGHFRDARRWIPAFAGMTVLIIPVAFAIHTVTAWLFETTYRPGWDSTNFGPYFVAGAFVAGSSAVIVVMYVLRKTYKLDDYITDRHFDLMGKILVMLSLLYLYFNIN